MLNFYYKPNCPFSKRVLEANKEIGAELTLLDVWENEALREELIAKGGKKQVPFLEDTTSGTMLYESNKIIAYLCENYGSGSVSEDPSPKVCPIE